MLKAFLVNLPYKVLVFNAIIQGRYSHANPILVGVVGFCRSQPWKRRLDINKRK